MALTDNPGRQLTASDLEKLTDEQVQSLGQQLFALIMPAASRPSPGQPPRPAGQMASPQRPPMPRSGMPSPGGMSRAGGMPPRIPRGQGNMVKRILQNRSNMQPPMPNPAMMRQPMQPQMAQPQMPGLYQPLRQPMGMPSGPFMAMNPYQMYG